MLQLKSKEDGLKVNDVGEHPFHIIKSYLIHYTAVSQWDSSFASLILLNFKTHQLIIIFVQSYKKKLWKNKLGRFQAVTRFERDLSGDPRETLETECDRKIDTEQIHPPPVKQSLQWMFFGYFQLIDYCSNNL